MTIILRWLGNAGFEFKIGGLTLIVDPFLTRPKIHQLYFGRVSPDQAALREYIPRCDHILVTHAHFDHCMDAPEIALRTGAVVHGSANTCAILRQAGVPLNQNHDISAGNSFLMENIRVSVIPAIHPWLPGYYYAKPKAAMEFPARLRDYRMDACFSYLLECEGRRILIWSSTLSAGAPRADLLACRAVSSQSWYVELLRQVQPRVAVPQHWDDFFQPLSAHPGPFFTAPRMGFPPVKRIDLCEFEKRVVKADPNCRVLLPEIFKPYKIDFPANSNTDKCFMVDKHR
jgi:L-ascorbate metabolism protein UlaG (beta-lactamase superfamily)